MPSRRRDEAVPKGIHPEPSPTLSNHLQESTQTSYRHIVMVTPIDRFVKWRPARKRA